MQLFEDLMKEVERVAAKTNRSLASVIEGALRKYLLRRQKMVSARRSDFPVDGTEGMQTGVSLDDNRALRSLLELRGLGKEHWTGLDAADHVDTERRSWD